MNLIPGSQLRDEERLLVARAQSGDRASVRKLVDLHKDRLHSFIWRMVMNHHDAEEICQEAFLKAFSSLHTFSSEFRFSTWLFTIGYRVCLNRMRRRRALSGDAEFASQSIAVSDGSADRLESEEVARVKEMVWSAVDRLSAPQRAAILLFYRHDQSCQDIARVLQLPLATVKSHLHRARAKLRELMEALSEKELSRLRNFSSLAG